MQKIPGDHSELEYLKGDKNYKKVNFVVYKNRSS